MNEPTHIIALPCPIRALEAHIHAICDNGGGWDGEVQLWLHKPSGVYVLELHKPETNDTKGAAQCPADC
jgi:hypothetical protein